MSGEEAGFRQMHLKTQGDSPATSAARGLMSGEEADFRSVRCPRGVTLACDEREETT